ncbi:hypothetical protein JD844_027406 [Phrynosoma platyrhinos]|uniref:Uncharacterized protein n=1 Tax=Phrynosoma platyrhinos TaxID=52577 RepID=A0ABQ7SG97_PHRPL|nr:hypothetical protein JD844_027406 [Phrynosoma platyrhinos]
MGEGDHILEGRSSSRAGDSSQTIIVGSSAIHKTSYRNFLSDLMEFLSLSSTFFPIVLTI